MPPGEHTPPSERTYGRLPLALFPELLDFPSDQVALEHAEVLQKKNSIQVVDLMAKGSRQQDLGFGVFSSSDVNNGEPQALSDLRSGQSHALRCVHRGKHVFGQLLQFGV